MFGKDNNQIPIHTESITKGTTIFRIVDFLDKEDRNNKYLISEDGSLLWDISTDKSIHPNVHNEGYLRYEFTMPNGNRFTEYAHTLVCKSFWERPNENYVVDHLDRNKMNNHYTNLRWVTPSRNARNVAMHIRSGYKGEILIIDPHTNKTLIFGNLNSFAIWTGVNYRTALRGLEKRQRLVAGYLIEKWTGSGFGFSKRHHIPGISTDKPKKIKIQEGGMI